MGAPRTPSSWRAGLAQSPMQEMFWLPCRSIWLAPIITWRRPVAVSVRCWRNGSQPSTLPGPAPMAGVSPISIASPSVSSRPGEKVSRARRAPMAGTVPIGAARISPAPRHASAQATTQYSARLAAAMPVVPVPLMLPPGGRR